MINYQFITGYNIITLLSTVVSFIDCSGNPGNRNVGLIEGGASTQTFCARSGSVITHSKVTLINNGFC